MQELFDQYWKIAVGIVGAIVLVWPQLSKVKDWMVNFGSKIKLPTFKKSSAVVNDVEDIEELDLRAIAHLRERASVLGNDELLKDIKSVYVKFYDVHSANKGN